MVRAKLAIHDYPFAPHFFNCASIARQSEQAQHHAASGFGTRDWKQMIGEIRALFASFFAPDDPHFRKANPGEKIALFHNTTSAVQRVLFRVLRELGGRDVSLLTADIEYPGCITALDDQWDGVFTMAEVARYLYNPSASAIAAHDALKSAFLIVEPRVVYLSHVSRYTGFVIDPGLLRFFRDVNPRCVIILDGSQGLGNVMVTKELLQESDFYISSGHKWVGGCPALGVVWSADVEWRIDDPAQATALNTVMGGTANDRALLSAEEAARDLLQHDPGERLRQIELHNRALARYFMSLVSADDVITRALEPITSAPACGLISLALTDSRYLEAVKTAAGGLHMKDKAVTYLERERWLSDQVGRRDKRWIASDLLDSHPTLERVNLSLKNVPMPNQNLVRFCFHYYHSADDVRNLATRLHDEIATIRF